MDKGQVCFKSNNENYWKEKTGKKPNTFRKIDVKDSRFETLRNYGCPYIRITNADTEEYFVRNITDYTEFEGYAIISWDNKKTVLE